MANSFVRYTGNGSTSSYAVPFSYRAQADVTITIDGVATTAFTWDGAGTNITFTSPPANLSSIEIRRTTSQSARLVDYADGSVLKENDLDTDSTQAFMMGQEAIDDAADKIKLDNADFQWDAQSKRLKNVADPTGAQDVATKNYIENTWLTSADKTALTTVKDNITNINSVNSNESNINTVAGVSANVTTVANNITSVNTVASDITKVVAVANDLAEAVSEVETVADDLNEATSEIDTVAGSITNVDLVGGSISNVNTVAGSITNVNNVGNDIANVNTVAGNLSGVNSFGERYRVASSAPASSTDVGDLYFDTTANELKVYKSSGWAAAGSTVNGTARRYTYNITGTPTTVSGADAKGETLAYDAGFVDVFLNGVRQSNTSGSYTGDVTVSSGTSVVFASALAAGDVVDVVAYGTFSAANIEASDITSGTINDARLPTTMAGKTLTTATVTGTINANTLVAKGDGSSNAGKITLNCENNSHGVKIQSPAHSAAQSYTLILPTSVGSANQVLASNGSSTNQLSWIDATETKPTITSTSLVIAPSTPTSVTIAGTNFASSSTVLPIVEAVSSTGVLTRASVVSWSSSTSISATFSLAQGDYRIRVENPDGNAVISANAILQSTPAPTWTTSAGSIATIAGGASIGSVSVVATSDSAVTYAKTSGTLPNGITIGSNGVFSGTESGTTATTVYTFDITATDAESQTAVRQFTITISHGATGGGQFN